MIILEFACYIKERNLIRNRVAPAWFFSTLKKHSPATLKCSYIVMEYHWVKFEMICSLPRLFVICPFQISNIIIFHLLSLSRLNEGWKLSRILCVRAGSNQTRMLINSGNLSSFMTKCADFRALGARFIVVDFSKPDHEDGPHNT